MKIEIDEELLRVCREYNANTPKLTDIGKLNKVAFVGEQICAMVKRADLKAKVG